MNDINCWEEKFELCVYTEKLLAKLELLNQKAVITNQVNIKEIKKAIYYAKKYHGEQRRLSGEPYYSHPLAVAELVAPYCFKTDILVASILHDVIEDTTLTKEMISKIFDTKIANNVEALTRIKSDGKISSAEVLESLWLHKKEEILIVKFFDRLHNMQTISYLSLEKKLKITKETFEKFTSLSIYLKSKLFDFKIDTDMITLCYQQLLPHQIHQTLSLMSSCYSDFDLPSLFSRNATIHTKTL